MMHIIHGNGSTSVELPPLREMETTRSNRNTMRRRVLRRMQQIECQSVSDKLCNALFIVDLQLRCIRDKISDLDARCPTPATHSRDVLLSMRSPASENEKPLALKLIDVVPPPGLSCEPPASAAAPKEVTPAAEVDAPPSEGVRQAAEAQVDRALTKPATSVMAEPAQENAKMERTFLFSSESVNEGHPDKLSDQVSDAVLNTCLTEAAEAPSSKLAKQATEAPAAEAPREEKAAEQEQPKEAVPAPQTVTVQKPVECPPGQMGEDKPAAEAPALEETEPPTAPPASEPKEPAVMDPVEPGMQDEHSRPTQHDLIHACIIEEALHNCLKTIRGSFHSTDRRLLEDERKSTGDAGLAMLSEGRRSQAQEECVSYVVHGLLNSISSAAAKSTLELHEGKIRESVVDGVRNMFDFVEHGDVDNTGDATPIAGFKLAVITKRGMPQQKSKMRRSGKK